MAEEKKCRRRVVAVLLVVFAVLAAINVWFYFYTYNHPVVIGSSASEKMEESCMRYAHELMGSFLGRPVHAQFIEVRPDAVVYLYSIYPPGITRVEHSDVDVPFWERGIRAYH